MLGPDLRRWEQMFNELLQFKDQRFRVTSRENKPLMEWAQRQRRLHREGQLASNLEARLNALGFPWTSNPNKTWEEMFAELAAHQKASGSCDFKNSQPSNRSLKHWCTTQRKLKAAGELARGKVVALNSLGFSWGLSHILQPPGGQKVPSGSSAWNAMFKQLIDYYKIHGDFNVPQVWSANRLLGRWVASQRSAWRQKQLPDERKRRLEAVGFDWRVHDSTWEKAFELARPCFAARQRDGAERAIPRKLRRWMITQRLQRKSGKLGAEREKRLSEAGFDWEPHQSSWLRFYAQLEEYHRAHGHCRVPADWRENRTLAHWVTTQRAARKEGKLSAERTEALDRLGFAWSVEASPHTGPRSTPSSADWEQMFSKVKDFKRVNGDFVFPHKTSLSTWAIDQRILRRRKELDPAHERALDEIGFDWDPINNRWERMFKELLEFKSQHGHVNVSQKSREYPKLAAWVAKQRFDMKKNRPILATRAHRLDELGFTWAFSPPASWEQRFDELLAYKAEHGDCRVPQLWPQNRQLGKWMNTQRTQLKRGKIDAERKAKLDSLGFVWDTKKKSPSLAAIGGAGDHSPEVARKPVP